MESENWNPGHSIDNTFPFDGTIASRLFYKNRPRFFLNKEGKVEVEADTSVFKPWETDQERIDFLFNRNRDAHEALDLAERQIEDMMREFPFIPEEYGFEVAHAPQDITDSPIRIYVSRVDPAWSLYRKPNDNSPSQSAWVLLQKREHGEFHQVDVNIPCARIAYAVLWSLGIKIKQSIPEVELTTVKANNEPPAGYTHAVTFTRQVSEDRVIEREVLVTANTDKEALTQAKFHLETDAENPIENVLFEELSL